MGDVSEIQNRESRRKLVLRWPKKILGPAPGLIELNLICWGLFLGFEILPFFVPIWLDSRKGTGFAHLLPVSFTYFYGIGRIVNEYSFGRLYDYSLQLKVFNDIYSLHGHTWGPSPYPPFVALFFSPFARMPFKTAYLIWVTTSLVLYLMGIAFAINIAFPKERLKASLIFCMALAFYPFFIFTLKNGQISTIGVFSVGLAVYQERQSRPFVSGLVLSILAYKPTLLLLVVPMLLVTRRFRTFLGFLTGGTILVLVTTVCAGIGIWPTYAHFLAFFQGVSVVNGQSLLQLSNYVDFTSLSYAVPGGRSTIGVAVLFGITGTVLAVLAVLLWRSSALGKPAQSLVWATTLTWTLLLNVYVPVWDSILVTTAVILTLGALRALDWNDAASWITLNALLIFAVTWNLAAKGNSHGSQLMTILLFVLGMGQLYLLYRAIRLGSTQGGNIPLPA
jgi:hypothetical protein